MERMEEMLILSRQLDFREVDRKVPLISASRWLVRRGEVTRIWWKGAGNDIGLGSHSSSHSTHTFSTEKLTFGRKVISRTNYVFFLFTDLLEITKRKRYAIKAYLFLYFKACVFKITLRFCFYLI